MQNLIVIKRNWYALYTKPRHEFRAKEQLSSVSVEHYLPTFMKTKQWSDRKKKIEEPLFRGYIFIYANEKERLTSLEQTAVVRTISFKGKPAVIPDWEIENLKKVLSESPEVIVSNKIETGAHVKITSGPFNGVEGIVTEYKKDEKYLAVSVELLQRSVLVRLPKESVLKIKEV